MAIHPGFKDLSKTQRDSLMSLIEECDLASRWAAKAVGENPSRSKPLHGLINSIAGIRRRAELQFPEVNATESFTAKQLVEIPCTTREMSKDLRDCYREAAMILDLHWRDVQYEVNGWEEE